MLSHALADREAGPAECATRSCIPEAESELVPQWQWTRLPCAVTPAARRAQCPWTQALAVLSDCQRDSDMLLFHGFSPATSQRPSEEASAARASLSAVSTVTPRLTASGQFEFTGKYPPLALGDRLIGDLTLAVWQPLTQR